MAINVCTKCGMPDTRPKSDHKDGVCLACRNYEHIREVNWVERRETLRKICEDRMAQHEKYDCVCPVSGGKDSTVIVSEMANVGMKILLMTVTDEFSRTKAGLHNIRNISERFDLDHYIIRLSPQTFKRETLKDFEKDLHPLKWVEERCYTAPVELAKKMKIPLVFYGENNKYEYGETNILDTLHPLSDDECKVYYLFAFYPYGEISNMEKARNFGFRDCDDFDEWFRQGNVENFTQIDSIGYMIHLWCKFPKFGFQRVSDITSRLVRKGQMPKEQADLLVREKDWVCDPTAKRDFCRGLGITEKYFDLIVDQHANHDILVKDANGNWRRKDLI